MKFFLVGFLYLVSMVTLQASAHKNNFELATQINNQSEWCKNPLNRDKHSNRSTPINLEVKSDTSSPLTLSTSTISSLSPKQVEYLMRRLNILNCQNLQKEERIYHLMKLVQKQDEELVKQSNEIIALQYQLSLKK